MIKIKLPEITKATKKKIILLTLLAIGLLVMLASIVIKAALWFDSNKVIVKSPIIVKTQRLITVEKRVLEIVQPVVLIDYPEEIDTDIKKYICEKFGLMDCKMALAIAKAESGINCNAININTNKTIDVGIFQLNSVHLKKGGDWTLTNMSDCHKNVDLAYELWSEQGWNPWVAYLNGSYLAKY